MRNPFVGLRSALLEFKNFRASGWLMFSICTVALIPLIYAGLFLLAFLDPYGSLANVPAAVVNMDQGAVIDGEERNLGQELCDELIQNNEDAKEGEASGYDWKFVSLEDADQGLRDASYYMELVIPENFSQTIADADSKNPQQAELKVYFNPSTNLIAQTVGSSMVTKIKAELNQKISEEYLDTIFLSIEDASDGLTSAVDGSRELANGLQDAQDGAASLANGLGKLQEGSASLSEGLDSAAEGAQDLQSGAADAAEGAQQLSDGLAGAQSGAQQLQAGAGSLSAGASGLGDGLKQVGDALAQLAAAVGAPSSSQTGATQLEQGLKQVAADLQKGDLSAASTHAAAVAQAAPQVGDELCTDIANLAAAAVSYQEAGAAAQKAAAAAQEKGAVVASSSQAFQAAVAAVTGEGGAVKVENVPALLSKSAAFLTDFAAYSGAMNTLTEAQSVLTSAASAYSQAAGTCSGYLSGVANMGSYASSTMSQQLVEAIEQLNVAVNIGANGQPSLVAGAQSVAQGASQLQAGAGALAGGLDSAVEGSAALSEGSQQIADGAGALAEGVTTAANGSRKITYNLGTAESGARELSTGIGTAIEGATELADGLEDGQEDMDESTQGKDAKAQMMAQPVIANGESGTGENITQVANYGTGFAPYFIGLGMWVGCLMITFLIRSMNNRLLMSRASSVSAVISSYIPMVSIAFLQVLVLLAFIQFGLKLNVNFPLQFYLFGLLTACCFMAIAQFVRAAMGTSGLVVLVVLLMLQLCTAAGTFPIESELPVFNALNPLLPMTYVVQGFRMAMCGLDASYMTVSAVVLAGFTVAFLFFTTLLAHRRRRIPMSTLYPKIQMHG
ncbi:MAG: YhgE/Pip family protein [Coriobacteriales bacterium]